MWFKGATKQICGQTLKSFCLDYVIIANGNFHMAVIAVGLIMAGISHQLMCLAGMMSHEDDLGYDASAAQGGRRYRFWFYSNELFYVTKET